MNPNDLPKCKCGATNGLSSHDGKWRCSGCLWIEIKRFRAAERILGDHPLILNQGGTSNADRAIRVITKLETAIERLNTWDGLMSLLDKHYPADIFDGSSHDPAPYIIALIREVDRLKARLEAAKGEE